jgi:formate-dependent nitrite reductase cytochrome c552 subunit
MPSAPGSLDAAESAACSPCHSGTNASPPLRNVMGEYSKTYAHPTLTVTGAHDPAESLPVNTTRHAACADCHNPHAAFPQTGTPVAPALEADLSGIRHFRSRNTRSERIPGLFQMPRGQLQ